MVIPIRTFSSRRRWGEETPTIDCQPMSATISVPACEQNQERALRAANLLGSGLPVEMVDIVDIDRLMACSQCEGSLMEGTQLAKTAILYWLDRMIAKLTESEEEWAAKDPEVMEMRAKQRRARYNKAHSEQRKEYMKVYRIMNQ